MLIRCPRCGFQQPTDKYCAHCGVDMEHYRPPRPSMISRVLGNPAVQVGAVLALAGFVGLGLYNRKQRDLQERVNYLKGETQVARSVSSPEPQSPPEPPPAEAATAQSLAPTPAPGSPAPAPAAALNAAASGAAVALADAKANLPDAAKDTTKPTPRTTVVRVYFTEVSMAALQDIWEESRATGQFNQLADHIAGIIPDLGKRLTPSNANIKILSREERPIEPGKPVQIFQGLRPGDPENELGFSYYIELQETDGAVFRGSLELMRSWRENNQGVIGPQKRLYPAVFELASGSGFFMSGLIPVETALAPFEELIAVSPFQILRSSAFRSRGSEGVLFLEFDRN